MLEYALGSQEAADKLENGQSGCGGSLAINRLSDNVGGVKFILSTPWHALMEERHFALAGWFSLANRRLAS